MGAITFIPPPIGWNDPKKEKTGKRKKSGKKRTRTLSEVKELVDEAIQISRTGVSTTVGGMMSANYDRKERIKEFYKKHSIGTP